VEDHRPQVFLPGAADPEVLDEVRSEESGPEEEPHRKVGEMREVDERQEEAGLGALKARWLRPALIVAIGLACFQQFIGINTIIYYAPTTLTSVGYGDKGAIYANLAIGVLNAVMTVLAIRLIDRVGRKPMLLGGLVGMVTSLTVLGVSLELLSEPKAAGDPAAIITLICLAGFIVSFAATWGLVVWVMLPEVLPLSVRGTAMGVAVCLHWGANFLVSQTFPVMLDKWGAGPVFLGYAVVGVLAFLFVKALVPETKGRSLEEIEAALQRKGGCQPATAGAGGGGVRPPRPVRSRELDETWPRAARRALPGAAVRGASRSSAAAAACFIATSARACLLARGRRSGPSHTPDRIPRRKLFFKREPPGRIPSRAWTSRPPQGRSRTTWPIWSATRRWRA
jgi:MFS family permease